MLYTGAFMKNLFLERKGTDGEAVRTIDLYLIAGQSNGAGYSFADTAVLKNLWEDYATGSPSVIYRGCAEYTNNVNTPQVSTGENRFDDWTCAKAGQGKSVSHMGAEVGMAARLSSAYYKDGRVCGIIKYAHGGTSIFDNKEGENAANGNWVSPSYAAAKGYSFAESTPTVKNLTGNLYRGLLCEVVRGVESLREAGYKDIRIKGVFWMQGESDRGYPDEYEVALGYFIKDLREDLGKIMGEDLSGLRIFPGLIDIHTHGVNGVDTMDATLAEMSRYYLSHGTTTWYPTTMTMSEEDIIKAAHANTQIEGGANIPGFHMEGPFINVKYKGAQNEDFIIPPSMELFNKCKNIKKVSLAPETEGAMEFIRECPAIVSIGHTDCD
jgi:hypothetical protein